ncbi:MAG: AzlD family protein [Flavobacteriaceae bacterium]
MSLDTTTLVTILGMAVATYLTRIAGMFIAGRLGLLTGRVRLAFDSIPPIVLISVVAPVILTTGVAETLASAVAVLAALRLPLLGVVVTGTAAIVALRMAGL